MFHSFFPNPKKFLLTAVIWSMICIALWHIEFSDWEDPLGIAGLFGWDPNRVWLYEYTALSYGAFVLYWLRQSNHRWAKWSVAGSALIVFATWFQVQLDVMINAWFGTFYDTVQQALADPEAVSAADYYGQLATFLKIAMVFIITAVVVAFFTSHYVFRWRTAMNDYYVAMWPKIRHIEGASQRIQEDTMLFARIMESLGSRFIDAVMTLLAFLPILWGLSSYVTELPVVGEVPQALVFVAILWSVVGTTLLGLAGWRLPGLEFRNQRVEAAFRKELVLGEDNEERARPPTLTELFSNVRKNYFRLYLNYLYFNVVRYSYLQAGVILPYIALGPTIISAGVTLGVMQQILRAFQRVENSFQFLVMSWTTIVELMSIYKRLSAFERAIAGDTQAAIEFEAEKPAAG
ncbi:peptide antibiotic transporter SbmA [Roseobacter sinensis]|uniref:Peptide antibiotic transporter SbmA n=1 Tax=Roseobacter sinensis TaxID=2931391 RepID=A0ABT3BJY6_9RHOB|nr:peptide antibiotic transporter SbmA [Roseobacter sp. WL0113]MCV3273669.1 peptide antibiotic transporter SbmA [Roseobacter sp. WL0113]